MQLVCTDMLRLIDKICKAEKITYFLSGGTLLGAVRHQGFIPWDDDIDVMMPRPEYERFLKAAPKYMSKRYAMVHPATTDTYHKPWIRILDKYTRAGSEEPSEDPNTTLFVDVFPVEGLPTNKLLCEIFYKKMRVYDILLKCRRRKTVTIGQKFWPIKMILFALTRVRSATGYALAMDRAAKKRNFYQSVYAGSCLVTHYGSRERCPAEVFRGSVNVTFEGDTYPAMIGYDTYLKNLYGNYMQLPPEEKRHPEHVTTAWIVYEEDRK